ncbi:substrate-binding domain-containing protein [Vibrio sp. ZSDE26]|uniref:Substrate-binding domain-containing protein n=1 Tax=Vibrio amylolyticus TaxID=2847292 RepID=A0A9X1XGA2_9VIBR|nr:substrate-binding domain-containing protein [Vibrio amylolyticus]MCK6262482.1 substrate-binding domain-containing protein [Vibrio amylolyticus]
MATIKDVAKEAGVSVATVSRVLNKSSKASQAATASVNKAMKQLGYRPNAAAQALVNQTTNTIGIVVCDVSEPFYGTMVKAIDKIAHQNNKHVLIGNGYHTAEQEKKAIELLINSRCEALIVHSKALSDKELVAYAKEVKGLVIINRHIPELASRCISLDNFRGAYLATELLIKNGHHKIACIASAHEIDDAKDRVDGYLAALKAHNIELPNGYIEYAEPTSEGGEDAMTNLLTKSTDMSAVVSYNDYMAAGALSIAKENSLHTPNKLSVIGFDDGIIAKYVSPRLTTVRYPIELMAQKAAELALMLSQGQEYSEQAFCYSPTLVQRESVMRHQAA